MGPIAGDLECFLTVTPGPMVPTEGLTVCSQGMPEDTVGGGPPHPRLPCCSTPGHRKAHTWSWLAEAQVWTVELMGQGRCLRLASRAGSAQLHPLEG